MVCADSWPETCQSFHGSRQLGAPAVKLVSRLQQRSCKQSLLTQQARNTFSDCILDSMETYLGSGGAITAHQLEFIILKHMENGAKDVGTWQQLEVGNHI